jgi:hypothetical protein
VIAVEPQVRDLLAAQAHEPGAESARRRGEGQHRPRKQLRGLQLVVDETLEELRARRAFDERFRTRCRRAARDDAPLRRPSGRAMRRTGGSRSQFFSSSSAGRTAGANFTPASVLTTKSKHQRSIVPSFGIEKPSLCIARRC